MKYQLETLTPVHVGSGDSFQHIDGCYANGKWHRIDLDKVFADPNANVEVLSTDMGRREFRWTKHLQNPEAFAIYSLSCPQSPEEVEIREAIKDINHCPYIPGSTLKGAIRTALLWDLTNTENNTHYKETLKGLKKLADQEPRGNPRRETPAKPIERRVLGENPNRDLLRALQVSDTTPIDLSGVEIGTAWTVTLNSRAQLVQKIKGNQEYKIFVEQLQTKQHLTFSIKIDEWLLKKPAKNQLGFDTSQAGALRSIAGVCNHATRYLMETEQDFFYDYGLTEIGNYYDTLLKQLDAVSKDKGAFILQVGWGGGYNANTITRLFTDNTDAAENLLIDLRKRFRLGESRSQPRTYDERAFPKTRRIFYRGQNPVSPFGWVKISPIESEK